MNPSMEQNLAHLVVNRQISERRTESLSEEDLILVQQTVGRIFTYPIERSAKHPKRRFRGIFPCNDPAQLMTDLGFNEQQKEALTGASLQFEVRANKDNPNARHCALVAVDSFALITLIGEAKAWKAAVPGSAEYLDVVTILNAFPSGAAFSETEA